MQYEDKWLWLTDIHLDFLSETEEEGFLHSLAAMTAAGLMITGDIRRDIPATCDGKSDQHHDVRITAPRNSAL